jgi:hypothetical protein
MSHRKASMSLADLPVAPPVRERLSTSRHATAKRARHAWVLVLALALAACGGGRGKGDPYKQATSEQEACCENLQGADRDQCMQQIVRVDDPNVASSSANQETYRCIERHFVCDPSTGHASQDSAQAQYDCIADLGQ